MKNITILGSTGSIGTQTLEVVDELDDYNIFALSCGKNIELLKKQILKYNPEIVSVEDQNDAIELKKEFKNIEVLYGEEGIIELSKNSKTDILVVATSGIIAVRAVISALKNKKHVALANKETLVMMGDIVTKIAKENNVNIIPIDSEHSAILQCLGNFSNKNAKRIWITASGGPFLNNTREEMEKFDFQEALKHPRWKMGKKITIDCATLVNKGLEVIEAHHLYNFDYENIKVLIHPESLVHSLVEFIDGSYIGQFGLPSMHIPIQYALTYPNRLKGIKTDSFNLFNKSLNFFEPDYKKFPLLKLTIECGMTGGIMPAVLNAANEVMVYKFLRGEIGFLEIEKNIFNYTNKVNNILNPTPEDIFEADKKTRLDLL